MWIKVELCIDLFFFVMSTKKIMKRDPRFNWCKCGFRKCIFLPKGSQMIQTSR